MRLKFKCKERVYGCRMTATVSVLSGSEKGEAKQKVKVKEGGGTV